MSEHYKLLGYLSWLSLSSVMVAIILVLIVKNCKNKILYHLKIINNYRLLIMVILIKCDGGYNFSINSKKL